MPGASTPSSLLINTCMDLRGHNRATTIASTMHDQRNGPRTRRRGSGARPASEATEADVDLFRQAIGEVRPLREGDARTAQRAQPPAPEPRQFLDDEARVMDELLLEPSEALAVELGEALSFVRNGHDPRLLKQLRRGVFAVQDEIDLHQMRQTDARRYLREFLAEAAELGHRCVRIIHGKGLRSPEGPVLKGLVDALLRHHGHVLAFASARPQDGGTGATLVLLRKP